MKYKGATAELKEQEARLDQWEEQLGMNTSLLHLTGEDIRKFSSDKRNEIAGELSSLAARIQRELNKNIAYVNFLRSKIDKVTANHLYDFEGYYSSEQRRSLAISNNEYAFECDRLREFIQMKVDRLANIPFQINQIVKVLHNNGK